MAYTRVNWVDNVTPLDQVNLNKMDAYIKTLDDAVIADAATTGAKVDKDSVVTAAVRLVASKLLAGDAQPALQINGDGKINWGAGGAAGVDTSLYRSAAGVLKTDGHLSLVGGIRVDLGGGSNPIYFGSAGDTNLYRYGTGMLRTDSYLLVANKMAVDHGGTGAKLYFGNAEDTSLYRGGAGELFTGLNFRAGASVVVNQSDGGGKLYFGSALDTNLYRTGAGTLKTDNNFRVGNYLDVDFAGAGYQIRFGSAVDTNLYRLGAGVLKTDGQLYVGSYVAAAQGAVGQATTGAVGPSGAAGIQFGSAGDATLYRNGANSLKTDGDLTTTGVPGRSANETGLGVDPLGVGARRVSVGAADSAGAGYRVLRVSN